jgi:hypothetical protein
MYIASGYLCIKPYACISNYYQVKLIITYNKVYVTLDATIKHVRRRRHMVSPPKLILLHIFLIIPYKS